MRGCALGSRSTGGALPEGSRGASPRWAGPDGPWGSRCPSSRAQREQIEKERLEAEKKAAGRLRHADELRRQVRENQQKQVQDRIATLEEGRRLQEEARKRRERVDDLKKKKIQELRWAPPRTPLSPGQGVRESGRLLAPKGGGCRRRFRSRGLLDPWQGPEP